MSYFRTLRNPSLYHGHKRRPDFFEGWYFKLINASGGARYAIIPGIFKHKNESESHAFIQTLDGLTGATTYHRYPVEAFQASETDFEVRVGESFFSAECLRLNITSPDMTLQGEIRFQGITPWPWTWASPGVMGWFGYLPFMECNHGVVSIDHGLEGELTVNGIQQDFSGGRGYIEKDWGAAFPSGYVWLQTNHFETSGTSLMASIAMIPNFGLTFRGFLCGLWHEGKLYRFATYTGAKVDGLRITDSEVRWALQGKTAGGLHRLEVIARRASGGKLKAPYRVGMLERVVESLTATAEIRLLRVENGTPKLIYSGQGRYAGLEVAGDLDSLADENLTSPLD